MKVTQHSFAVAILGLVFSFTDQSALAVEPIDADGPDFVESSEVIGKNRFQYEADLVSQRDQRTQPVIQTTSTPALAKELRSSAFNR